MMNAAAGIFLEARRKPKLPYDAEVEYLESTGTQWIDTGMFLSASSSIRMLATLPDLSVNLALFGACNGALYNNGEISVFIAGPTLPRRLTAVYPTGNSSSAIIALSNRPKYTPDVLSEILYDGTGFTIQGAKYQATWYSAYQAERTCALFAVNRSGGNGQYPSQIKVSGFAMEDGGTLVRDFVPVRFTNELGQSEGAMYDRANPTVGMNPDGSVRTDGLYRNRGTGAFVIGADKTA